MAYQQNKGYFNQYGCQQARFQLKSVMKIYNHIAIPFIAFAIHGKIGGGGCYSYL